MSLPEYVSLNGMALKLEDGSYYRVGGKWRIGFKFIDGALYSWGPGLRRFGVHKVKLKRISKRDHDIDNGLISREKTKSL